MRPAPRKHCIALFSSVVFGGLTLTSARADDGAIVATQIGFASRACVVEVDRDAEPVVEIPFTIPFEDATLGIHEPPNSRRVQLFAFCRPPRPDEALPTWISLAEAEGAVVRGELELLPPDEDILERSAWADIPGHDGVPGTCVHPLNTVAGRVPLTCAASASGVAWDTRGVPSGPYVIQGYTYAPINNRWSHRAGVVNIHDGAHADPQMFAVLLDPARDAQLGDAAPLRLRGCTHGAASPEVTVEWARATADLSDPASWQEATTFGAAPGEPWTLELEAPAAANNQAIVVRAGLRSEDAATAPRWSYPPGRIAVAGAFETSAPADGSPAFDFCDIDTAPSSDPGGCRVGGAVPVAAFWWIPFALASIRRYRKNPHA